MSAFIGTLKIGPRREGGAEIIDIGVIMAVDHMSWEDSRAQRVKAQKGTQELWPWGSGQVTVSWLHREGRGSGKMRPLDAGGESREAPPDPTRRGANLGRRGAGALVKGRREDGGNVFLSESGVCQGR